MDLKTIWNDMTILHTKNEHISTLLQLDKKTAIVYSELANHLDTLSLVHTHPSKIDVLIPLFEKFDEVNSEMDRALLNLYIYINHIRVEHLECIMQAGHMEKIGSLLSVLSEQRRSLNSCDYVDFFEHLNDQKNKNVDNYYPYLSLLERKTFKMLLNGLMGIKMMVNFVIKHLEKCDHILDSLDIKIKSNISLYS